MNLFYLSTWAVVLRAAALERTSPIASFSDPVQAMHHMYRQNAAGDTIQVITNDGELYWVVSAGVATRLYQSNFYPLLGACYLPEQP